MASPENKLLQAWFAPTFKAAGFKKIAATWRRRSPSFVHVFNIQGSQWSRYFNFNLGIYITALGDLNSPSDYHCHVRERVDGIVPDIARFQQLSDFEQGLPEEQRRSELMTIISASVIPWLDRMSSIEQLRHYILREKKHGLPITTSTYHHLQIQRA